LLETAIHVLTDSGQDDRGLATALERDGYLHLPRFAEDADVEIVFSALTRIHQKRIGIAQGAQYDFVGDGTGKTLRFPQIQRPSDFAPELLRTKFYNDALALARDVLGAEAEFIGDHALIKPARVGPPTPWHQDEAFRNPYSEFRGISVWLAARATTVENGCMEFVSGSNNGALLDHRRLGADPRVQALECIGPFDAGKAVKCPLPAGGVTVHAGRTLHAAGPNLSDADRIGYVLQFGLPPRPAEVIVPRPWLDALTAREQREIAWKKRGGVVLHVWRRLRHLDLTDGKQLRYALKRGRSVIAGLFQ
jgi:hypothetical protein